MIPLGQNPPTKLKKNFYSKLYNVTSHCWFEQLSSSNFCRVMAGQSFPWKGKLCLFWKVLN